MRCPKCDCENPIYAVVCERCGEFLPKEDPLAKNREPILDPKTEKKLRCSYCWHMNPGDATFCAVCGMPLMYVPHPEVEGEFSDVPKRGEAVPGQEEDVEEEPIPEPIPEPVVEEAPKKVAPNMVRCRVCWHDNPKDALHCESCGAQLKRNDSGDYGMFTKLRSTEIYCKVCNAKVPWSALTCPRCGANPRDGKHYYDRDDAAKELVKDTFAGIVKGMALDWKEAKLAKEAEKAKIERSKLSGYQRPAGTVRCYACGTDNPAGTERCQECGKQLRTGSARDIPKVRVCKCGYENLPGVTICLVCGGRVKLKCPICGYENPPGSSICAYCRVRLSPPKQE